MRHAAVLLIVVLATIHAVMAAARLLPNGLYRIYNGNSHHPPSNRYFTGKTDASSGSVILQPTSTSSSQIWRLRNHSNGQVSLELLGKKKHYLSEGKSGINPGAHMGVTKRQRRWDIVKVAGGSFTRYTLSYTKEDNKTLVVSTSTGSLEPKRVAFQYEDNPDVTKAWKFARYYR